MVKNFLKTSVFALIFLGIFKVFSPSQAMEEGDLDRQNLPLKQIGLKSEEFNGNFSFAPEEITQKIFLHLNPKDILSTAFSCKKALRVTLQDENFLKAFYAKHKDSALEELVSSPPRIFWYVFNSIAPEYPFQLTALDRIQSSIEENIPQNILNFALVAKDLPLGHYFIKLDPLDFQKVALAGLIIKQSENIQKELETFTANPHAHINNLAAFIKEASSIQHGTQTLNSSHFNDVKQFQNLIKDRNKHEALKHYLMALKLLALSDEKHPANTQLECFAKTFLNPLFESVFIEKDEKIYRNPDIKEEGTYLIQQPFWSAFTLNRDAHEKQIRLADKIWHSSTKLTLERQRLHKLEEYVFNAFPILVSRFQ